MPLLGKLIEDHGIDRCPGNGPTFAASNQGLWDEIQFDVHHARHISAVPLSATRNGKPG